MSQNAFSFKSLLCYNYLIIDILIIDTSPGKSFKGGQKLINDSRNWMYVFLCVDMCGQMCVYRAAYVHGVHVCGSQRLMLNVFIDHSPP